MCHTKTTETRVTRTVFDKVGLMRYKDFDGFQPIIPRIIRVTRSPSNEIGEVSLQMTGLSGFDQGQTKHVFK